MEEEDILKEVQLYPSGTLPPTPTIAPVTPGELITLSPAARSQKIASAMDMWINNIYFISMLFMIAVIVGIMKLIGKK